MGGDATTVPEDPDAPAEPRHLGRYQIEEVIGAGGMGLVLAAHDPELDRHVAIKLLRSTDAAAQELLISEAQAMARLRHPNVVAVHDVGVEDGRVFVAMELVEGVTLRAWLSEPRPWRAVIARYVAAGRGLAAAHAAGIVHRDFKPDNVLVGDDDSVRVADFGLAEVAHDPGGTVVGTPAYMPPEQHAGDAVGPAADQFAFATALWEALTGARPFSGATPAELHRAKEAGKIAAPSGDAPRWVFALLRRGLAARPEDRHGSLTTLVAALERGLGRRRRVVSAVAGLTLIAGTAAAAVAVSAASPAGPNCRLAAAEVDRVWNDAARERLTAGLRTSTRPYAAATIDRVVLALGRHAGELAAARVEVCADTHQRGRQSGETLDRRMACLDRRAAEMSALLDVLGRGPVDEVIDSATDAVNGLPGAERCTATALAAHAPPPAAIAAQVAAVEQRRAEAEALRGAGRLPAARAAFDALIVDARALAYAPLLAAVARDRGATLSELSDVVEGRGAFEEAARAAALIGDDAMIARAWMDYLQLHGDEGGQPDEALARLPFVEVAVTRSGDPALEEELHFLRSDIHLGLGKLAEARTDIEAALASFTARGADEPRKRMRFLQQQARILFQLGDNARALALDREAIDVLAELLGPDHLQVARLLSNQAMAVDAAGDSTAAEAMLRRSLSIKERTLSADDPSIAVTLHNLGMVVSNLGRVDEAIALTSRALAIREKAFGPKHASVSSSLSNLASQYLDGGHYAEALAIYQRSLALREEASGPDHPALAFPLEGIARALAGLDRADEAVAFARRALAIREKALGPEAPAVGKSLSALADIYVATGNIKQACRHRARAVTVIEAAEGPESPTLIDPLTGHAQCLLNDGDIAAARAAAERVIALVESSGAPEHMAGPPRMVLAEVLWRDPATRERARAEATRARQSYEGLSFDTTWVRTAADNWLASHR